MSWAATFNSGNSMGTDLSNKMAGIRLDSNISPAEIQAKIKKYNPELQNQNILNTQNQAQTDTFQAQNNTQNAAPVQYNTYGPPLYQGYQMTANYPVYQQGAYTNYQQTGGYYNNMPQPVYQTAQSPYIQPVYTQAGTQMQSPVQNGAQAYQTLNNNGMQTQAPQAVLNQAQMYQNNVYEPAQTNGQNLDINTNDYTPLSFSSEPSTENASQLETYYASVSDKGGIISKGTDKIKSLFNMKGSSKDVQNAIEQYKNGLISYDEANNKIKEYESGQNSSTGALTTALSAIGGYIGSALIASKGTGAGKTAAAAALIGAGIKAAAGIFDRATNKVSGDTLNLKDLTTDVSKGLITGAITSGASMLSSDKFIVPSAANGAITGAITGAATGVTDYSIDSIAGNGDFSINDMIAQSVKYAAGGTLIGAGTGKISSKFIKPDSKILNQSSASSGNTVPNLRAKTEIKSFDDCKNLLRSGNNVSSTERVAAIKEGVKYETDEGVQKLYQQFLDNPNEETLKKFYRAASKKYHPDLPANKGVEAAGEKFVYYGNLQSFAEKNMTLFSKAA